jgi:hypothetical protein
MTTPADPGAIDLDASKRRLHKSNAWPEIKPIIAAVEALRERAEAAEARVVELEGALESVKGQFGPDAHFYGCECGGFNPPNDSCNETRRKVLAALSTTPAEALERARALRECAVNIAADEIILLRERLRVRQAEVDYLGEQLNTAREAAALYKGLLENGSDSGQPTHKQEKP